VLVGNQSLVVRVSCNESTNIERRIGSSRDHTDLSDDARDQRVRRHVERRVPDMNAVRSDLDAIHVSDFGRRALFDHDLIASLGNHIQCRSRCCDEERNAMEARQYSERIGAWTIDRSIGWLVN